MTAGVAGRINDLAALNGIDLTLGLETAQLPEVVKQAGVEVPVELPARIKVDANISGSLDELAVANYRVDLE